MSKTESPPDDVDQLYGDLRRIEQDIKASEGDSVVARWKFGRALIQRREGGKQLPTNVLAGVEDETGISRSEIHRRMKLAEKFSSEDEVSHAWATYGSWRRIASEVLRNANPAGGKAAWDDARIEKRIDRIIDDAETEEQLKTLAELFRKALDRVEVRAA